MNIKIPKTTYYILLSNDGYFRMDKHRSTPVFLDAWKFPYKNKALKEKEDFEKVVKVEIIYKVT